MKKILINLILCVSIILIFLMHHNRFERKYDELSNNVNILSQRLANYITTDAPLSVAEVETFQHNIDVLNNFYGRTSNRSTAIANQCITLKRAGSMGSARIVEVKEHNNSSKREYWLEILTDDNEHYWFWFEYDSSYIYAALKGENKDVLLFRKV